MKFFLAAILVTLCFLGGPLSADEIILNNGDYVTGNVVELGEEEVRMITASGEIIIPRSRVASAFLGEEIPFVSSREDGIGNSLENSTSAHGPEAMSENILEE